MRAEGKIDVIFVLTSTKKNNFYNNMVDTKFVMHYGEKLLVQFLEEGWGHIKQEEKYYSSIWQLYWLGQLEGTHSGWGFSTHRHTHVSILVSTQYPNKLPTLIWEVSCLACIFKQVTRWSWKAIYDSYGEDYGTMNELIDYMNSLPKHAFICVDTTKSGKERYKKMRLLAKITEFCYTNTIWGLGWDIISYGQAVLVETT